MASEAPAALTPVARAHRIKEQALALGFASVGITDLHPTAHADALDRWLAAGMAGTMAYMHRQARLRREPQGILPGATRAIVVTRNYYSASPHPGDGSGRVARYAQRRDYHDALAAPLEELARHVRALGPPGAVTRAFVDAGPVPERELAQRAGLGWIGKNTMLLDPARGSFSFIAVILTSVDAAIDPPFQADRCGTCRRCLDACPTQAFPEERVLDSRRCVSYLTIEHRGDVDPALAGGMGDWVFGCDVCQEVCPWNVRFAVEASDPVLAVDPSLSSLTLAEVVTASDADLNARFGHTALARAGPEGLRRSAAIALDNLHRDSACPTP